MWPVYVYKCSAGIWKDALKEAGPRGIAVFSSFPARRVSQQLLLTKDLKEDRRLGGMTPQVFKG